MTKLKVLTHISALRWLVKLDIQDKYGFFAGIRFGDDHEVFKIFVDMHPNYDKMDADSLPAAVERAFLAAAELDFKDSYGKVGGF